VTNENGTKHALVLSGGGAKGSYEIGVMKALFEGASPTTNHEPLEVEIYTGTSVGSYHASFMTSKGEAPSLVALDQLDELWRYRIANTPMSCGNGVFRIRGAPFQFFDPSCLLRRPVEEVVELTKDAGFWTQYFLVQGTQFVTSTASLGTRILQSFDLSAFISPAPLDALIAETIDLTSLRASPKRLTIAASNWEYGRVQLFSKSDITDRFGTDAIRASAAIPGFFPPVILDDVPYVDGGVTMNTPLRPAIREGADVLHVIYLDPLVQDIPFPAVPKTDLGGIEGLLDFSAKNIAHNIALGYQDAVAHDCGALGCRVPS